MVQNATVIGTSGKYAEIEVSRKAMCDGCHKTTCGSGCPMSGLFSVGGKMTAVAVNEAGATAGDRVEIQTSDRKVLGVAAAVFMLPLVIGGVFYAVALLIGASQQFATVSAIVGFVFPFPFLKIAEKYIKDNEPKLVVKRILNHENNIPEENE